MSDNKKLELDEARDEALASAALREIAAAPMSANVLTAEAAWLRARLAGSSGRRAVAPQRLASLLSVIGGSAAGVTSVVLSWSGMQHGAATAVLMIGLVLAGGAAAVLIVAHESERGHRFPRGA